jgi:hypothetical protein
MPEQPKAKQNSNTGIETTIFVIFFARSFSTIIIMSRLF